MLVGSVLDAREPQLQKQVPEAHFISAELVHKVGRSCQVFTAPGQCFFHFAQVCRPVVAAILLYCCGIVTGASWF